MVTRPDQTPLLNWMSAGLTGNSVNVGRRLSCRFSFQRAKVRPDPDFRNSSKVRARFLSSNAMAVLMTQGLNFAV